MSTFYQTTSNHNYLYIDNNTELQSYCETIKDSTVIFIDTEFIREKTYSPVLCLIQVATADTLACIDPLAISNLDIFLDIIFDCNIIKVFHAARQDLEIFYNLRNTAPEPVFDTQIAATLLGHADQIGYANLVKSILKVTLDKKYARTDWTQRPLSREQLEYAINDVIYLRDIYNIIHEKLATQNRLEWLTDDFQYLSDNNTFELAADKMWRKVKGHNKLNGLQRAVLQELAGWREEKAATSNKPRKWILSDDVLISLAQHQPTNTQGLTQTRGLNEGAIKNSGKKILEVIKLGLQRPQESWPTLPKFTKTTTQQDALIDCMMAMIRLAANKEKISTTMLCSRKDLEKWLVSGESIALLSGWRNKIAGQQLVDFLNGSITLSCQQQKLIFTHQ